MNKKQTIILYALLGVAFYVLATKLAGAGFPQITNAKALLKLFLGVCVFIGGGVLSVGIAANEKHKK